MAVHKIKAKDAPVEPKPAKVVKKPPEKPKPTKTKAKSKPTKKRPLFVRILLAPLKPFVALGRYFRASWREIRRVVWPNRKFTWKMTLAVIIFVVFFATLISLLDMLFTLIFNNLIK